jgi:hypothetical protein
MTQKVLARSWWRRAKTFCYETPLVPVVVTGLAIAHYGWWRLQDSDVVKDYNKPRRTLVSDEVLKDEDMVRVEAIVQQLEAEGEKAHKEFEGLRV